MSRVCPDCRIELQVIEHQRIHLDACPQCAGIWFDDSELRNVQDSLTELDRRVQPESYQRTAGPYRLCPECDSPLARYRYLYTSNVELDGCDRCGGCWVENGELNAMHEFLTHERSPPSTPEEMQKLLLGVLGAQGERSRVRAKEVEDGAKGLVRRPFFHWWVGYGGLKD